MATRTPRQRRPSGEKATARVILDAFRRLRTDVADLTERIERHERQCDANVRRCAEMQAEIDRLKKRD